MRKTKEVRIETPAPGAEPNRDAGKLFLLTEMPAMKAEAWATRMWLALAKNNTDIPSAALSTGWAGLVSFGIVVGLHGLTRIDYADLQPLLHEMMACVQIAPDPRHTNVVRALNEDDIEEVSTIVRLRDAVVELHTGFSFADALSRAASATTEAQPS